jgi:hypothetical protein
VQGKKRQLKSEITDLSYHYPIPPHPVTRLA